MTETCSRNCGCSRKHAHSAHGAAGEQKPLPEPSYTAEDLARDNRTAYETIDCTSEDIFSSTLDLMIRELIRSGRYIIDAYRGKIYRADTMNEIGYRKENGYMYVTFLIRGLGFELPIHRIIYLYVHPEYTAGVNSVIHHIDGNKTNNAASNLLPLTAMEHNKLHRANEPGDAAQSLTLYERITGKEGLRCTIEADTLREYIICMRSQKKHSYGRGLVNREFGAISGLSPTTLKKYNFDPSCKAAEFTPEEIDAVLKKYAYLIERACSAKRPNQYTHRRAA